MPDFSQYEPEYIAYCIEQEQTVSHLEARLHESDDPKEIATLTLKTVCDFYGADWAGILDVDLDLDIWAPLWWHNIHSRDHTLELFRGNDIARSVPNWAKALKDGTPVTSPDTKAVQTEHPKEYEIYKHLRAEAVMGMPFSPNPVGFLVIRNPKRYLQYPSTMGTLAYVLHRAMTQQKTIDSAKLRLSPDEIKCDKDVIVKLFGNIAIYTSTGVLREQISGLICSCFYRYNCKHEFAAMLQLKETLELIEKNYADEYERTGYFAAINKGTLFAFAIDGKDTGSFTL